MSHGAGARATPHTGSACLPALQRMDRPRPAGPWGELAWPKEVERAARVGLVGWDARGAAGGVPKPPTQKNIISQRLSVQRRELWAVRS